MPKLQCLILKSPTLLQTMELMLPLLLLNLMFNLLLLAAEPTLPQPMELPTEVDSPMVVMVAMEVTKTSEAKDTFEQ